MTGLKDLLLCVHAVVKILNLEISRNYQLQTSSKNCVQVRANVYYIFYTANQRNSYCDNNIVFTLRFLDTVQC